ncbi:cytochrome c oxidase subunit 3 [Tanacetum coccineum]|uniref:Cytochrome c oxidase subunit 3 n=1 Tax=Tanacetum coccineum TaxID=301880 RepID=A0ABQ5B8T7_9ASTR
MKDPHFIALGECKFDRGLERREVMFLFALFWASSHSSVAPMVEIGGIWPPKGIAVLDPREIPFLNNLIPLSSGAIVTWAHYALSGNSSKKAPSSKPNGLKLNPGCNERNRPCVAEGTFCSELKARAPSLPSLSKLASEVHTADQLPLPRYGLDDPPVRSGLSDGYNRTIEYADLTLLRNAQRRLSTSSVENKWGGMGRREVSQKIQEFHFPSCSSIRNQDKQGTTHKPRLGLPPSLEEPYEAEAPRMVLKSSLSSNGA